ncbi:MAG: DUF1080 domain-containing protein [Candidatus Marinimicrobia bacterium]|jgi:hypothetical protein|nr:DUF1080 domain-containing protein [Candidatus Neomarinimicrobiota bacterium]
MKIISRYLLPIIFAFIWFSCVPQPHIEIQADQRMGDWTGTRINKDGQEVPMAAQLIAYKNGRFTANLITEFDKKENHLATISGKVKGNEIQLIGSYKHGTRWKGIVTDTSFNGVYHGQDHGTFTMKKVTRLSPYLGKEAPEGVIVLFDGSNLDAWTQESNIPGYLDLSKHVGGSECAEYLRTDVWSDINQDAILELGSNDGVAGWLNGEMIISENVLRRATPGQGMIPVSLKSGWNTFLMKIVNAGGGWGMFARLMDKNENPLQTISENANGQQTKEYLQKNDNFLTLWDMTGPYRIEGKNGREIFDHPFPPENDNPDVSWEKLEIDKLGDKALWLIKDDAVEIKPGTSGMITRQKFTNFTLHIEFRLPFMPNSKGQGRGNSGVYLQGRYEVQVLDSYGLEGKDNECGGIYKVGAPAVNMCAPPMQWQSYDIDFTAPTFGELGEKITDARVTVNHNGVIIHNNAAVPKPTGGAVDLRTDKPGVLMLQDHGNPVQYRNIWIIEK